MNQGGLKGKLRLYAVTDPVLIGERSLTECVRQAIEGGTTCIQLRDKQASPAALVAIAAEVLPLCRKAQVPLIINDSVEAAIAVDADGVHLGQDDLACRKAREAMGPGKIIGMSVQTVGQALEAQANGCDYLGIGAMFPTPTKPDAADVSFTELAAIRQAVRIPAVVIGGINDKTIPRFSAALTDGFAVVSGIFAHEDIVNATGRIEQAIERVLGPSGKSQRQGGQA